MKGINQAEFDRIFREWYQPIRNFLYYKCSDVQIAEDIAQDTFLKLWEKREEIKADTVKSLLYRIASNLLINRHQHQSVVFKFAANYQSDNTSEAADFDIQMKEFDNKLQKALADLDEKQRTVFLMNRIDGFTYNEIAQSLDLSVKAVEKRMEKALAFMRERIKMKI